MKQFLKHIPYLFLILLLVTTTGCKDDDEEQAGPETAAMLSNGAWIGTTVIEDGENVTEQYAAQNQDIRKLEIVFTNNGRVTSTYNDGRPEAGTWKLVNDNKAILFMENTPNEMEGKILVLTETDFRVKNDGIDLELRFVKK